MDSTGRIRVGIIGASPDRGWARRAHVPALAEAPDLVLTAVGTSRTESAEQAARQYGAAHAFTDPRRLAEHPDVDLVVVTVKVPAHVELVGAALAAGKHVYCEWPLTATTAQARALASAAEGAGVIHAVGLNGRFAPAARHAADLVADGVIGRLVSVSAYAGRAKGAADAVPAWSAYTYDRENGAGTLEVGGGHTLDLLQRFTGPLAEVTAALTIMRPARTVAETGTPIAVSSPDHVLVHASTASGVQVDMHLHDGARSAAGTRIVLSGTAGDLVLQSVGGQAGAGVQIEELELVGEPPTAPPATPTGTEAANVGRLYGALAATIRGEAPQGLPDFTDGVRLHELLDAVRRADETGARQAVEPRPCHERHSAA